MMINVDYSAILAQAKTRGDSHVDFKTSDVANIQKSSHQDKLTISNQAMSLHNGNTDPVQEISPIYVKPQTANELIAKHNSDKENVQVNTPSATDNNMKSSDTKSEKFSEVMQAILDKRLGVDRKKLEELEALMKQVAENENLSPEAKEKAMKEIEKMREKVIEESIEVKKTAKQTFSEPSDKD